VVEDDQMTIELMRAILSSRYNVLTAINADKAKECLQGHAVDIVLMDISLLGSRNGLELTQEIKTSDEWKHIPVIAVTAHAYMRDKKNALDAGCDYYFAKPISRTQLIKKMEELLRKSEVGA
jgi:CheY-like chemotaxis protein